MNRNQKIALGCGGAGCLGLIVLIIVGVLWWLFIASSVTNRNGNNNSNINSNSNANTNRGSDTNANRNSNSVSDSNSVSSTSSSSMSDDDKHRLYHAAGITKDNALIQRVLKKIGFLDDRGTTTAEYETFVNEHWTWALKNTQFVLSINSEEKARAYINEHLD